MRPNRNDVVLAAALAGVAILSGISIDSDRPSTTEPVTWWHWALLVAPALLVAVRRLDPVAVTALATGAQVAIWTTDLPEVLLPIVVILFTAASDAGRRGLVAALVSSLILTIVTGIGVAIADDVTIYQLPLIAMTCGTAIVLGTTAARQRRLGERLAADVAEVRLRSEHQREQAIAGERSHIARELHDIIGHTLSVIAVRAEAADRVADQKPEAATEAVSAIAGAARAALTDTRRVLAGLRESSAVDLTPPPDLSETAALIDRLRGAGVDVDVVVEGQQEHPPPAVVAGGAHRIVQESLTNAIKHGGPAVRIDVSIVCTASTVHVAIANDLADRAMGPIGDQTGIGLTGMRERATFLGGTFDAGIDDGRFVVEATLPTNDQVSRTR